jgi:hypothetical protein
MIHFLLLAIAQASLMELQDATCGNIINEMKYIDRGFCFTSFTFRKTETTCLDKDILVEAIGNIIILYIVICVIVGTTKAIYSHFVH